MKTGTAFAATLFALASFPLLAQQPSTTTPPNSPAQQNPPDSQPAQPESQTATPDTPAAQTSSVEMSPVKGELVSKLDSKTAKTGDNVVIQTKTAIKTADGTEIPKGSKLVGHVIAAQPSGQGTNSQVALQFDTIQLKTGQNLAVHTQIQSIGSAQTGASAGGSAPSGGSPASGSSPSASGGGSKPSSASGGAPQGAGAEPGPAGASNGGPAPGTVVAKNGNIAISTTSIPGVLLANNAPGEQDPRMAKASSILLGAKQDIQLDGGTQMVVAVAAAGGGGAQ
jgi:hypothetical protein